MVEWVVLGLIAGALTTSGYIPQIVKGYRTKKMNDVSILMISILCVGMFLWIVYGYMVNDLALLISNIIGTTFLAILVTMKFHYTDGKPAEVRKQ
jgi:MtN3 and saliva related transmembrane protein